MRKELEKYGIQMPAFSKIGGILESEVSIILVKKLKINDCLDLPL